MGCEEVSLLGSQSSTTRHCSGFQPKYPPGLTSAKPISCCSPLLPTPPHSPSQSLTLWGHVVLGHSHQPLIFEVPNHFCEEWILLQGKIGRSCTCTVEILQSSLRSLFNLGDVILCSSWNSNDKNYTFQHCKNKEVWWDAQCATNSEN